MKRATTLFLGLLLLAMAATAQVPFTYLIENGGVVIHGYYGGIPPSGDFIIPPSLDNLPVVGIADYSFSEDSSITNVEIPASVTQLSGASFAGCLGLVAINVDPQNLTYASSNGVLFNKSMTTLVEFPGGMSGSYAIPISVTNITVGAFQECSYLTNVTLPNGLISIGDYAFESCGALTEIVIPTNVSAIGTSPFSGCASMTAINVAANNFRFRSTNGVLFNKPQTTIIECPGGMAGGYSVPNSVKTIEWSAFENCSKLTNIVVPSSVTNIGDGAFFGCASLAGITVISLNTAFSSTNGVLYNKARTSLLDYPPGAEGSFAMPSTVTNIAEEAFQDCKGLTGIQLPSGLSSINRDAFYNCLNLTGVTIPGSVSDIGAEAFEYCTRLSAVTINNGVGNIESNAFENCFSLVNASIPASVTNIGQSAFEYCLSLPTVRIPTGVTAIGNQAFEYCSGMKSVTIANTVSNIGQYAFAYCSGLATVTLPAGVANIAPYTFYECAGLTHLVIPSNVNTIGVSAFEQCYGLTAVTISPGVAIIGNSAFNGCASLAEISVPSSVTSIGFVPFSGCASLTGINVDEQNPFYSTINGVLCDKKQTTIIECPNGLAGNYTIPSGITQLAGYSFVNCSALTNITIPDSVASIGALAFENCAGLTTMNFPSSVNNLGADTFYGSGATNFYFLGNAPAADPSVFAATTAAMVYYFPGSSGWAAFSANTGALATVWNPVIQVSDRGFGVSNSQFGFNITGSTNLKVVVEACSNLTSPVWTPIETVTLSNGLFHFSEPINTNSAARFYGLGFP
ncbi:MAG TPA: leucine-rich repeat domain-containing protein [Verrucomicrobiae bacterium]|jgi:hypothetical protein